jgi:hypothetical protein
MRDWIIASNLGNVSRRSGRARNIQSKADQSADHIFTAHHSTQRQQQAKEITIVVVRLPQKL